MPFENNNNNEKISTLTTLVLIGMAILFPFIAKHIVKENKEKTQVSKISLPQKQTVVKKTPVKLIKPLTKQPKWQKIITKEGDSLARLFKRLGLPKKELHLLLAATPNKKYLTNIAPQQKIELKLLKKSVYGLKLAINDSKTLILNKVANQYHARVNEVKRQKHQHYLLLKVNNSLYQTAQKQHIPIKLIRQLEKIFTYKVDFDKDIRKGDFFTLIYNTYYVNDKPVAIGDIVAVSFSNKQQVHYAFRYKKANGTDGYYDELGKSLELAFNRYPLHFSHVSSTFSLTRMHPILQIRRPHKGMDLAANIGTPIKAVADGKITQIGRNHGYGNMVKIKHSKKFSTIYAHMLRFKRGLSLGSWIRRGQVIGYVGQTGLATGPHCHFEVHRYNHPVNPATISLPRSQSIPKTKLSKYKAKVTPLLAQLKLFQEASLASAREKIKS